MLTLNLVVQVTSWATDEGGQRQSTERNSWHRIVSVSPRIIRCAQSNGSMKRTVRAFSSASSSPRNSTRSGPSGLTPADARTSHGADMLRITVELLPGGGKSGAVVISRRALPIADLAGPAKADRQRR